MAVPLDVDWEAIEAHALVHGVRAAARDFGISEDAVRQRSARYGWLKGAGVAVVEKPLPNSMKPRVTSVTKAPEAARKAMAELSTNSRLYLAKAVEKGSEAASRLDGDEVLQVVPALKGLADTGDKVFGWSGAGNAPTLRLELIAKAVSEIDVEAIDVEAEVEVSPKDEAGA